MSTTQVELTHFSPPQVARMLGVSHAKVLAWIDQGDLVAFDLTYGQKERPRYRISRDQLDQFLAARSTQPPALKPPVQRKRKPPKDYFA